MINIKILGIDEAGRGPVIGPMVMCGFLIEDNKLLALNKMGVKDSKQLTPPVREKLAKKLEKLSDDIVVLKMDATEIDSARNITNLNKLEIKKMCEIINALSPDKAFIDAIESNTSHFRKKILGGLENGVEVIAENFADVNYPIVSASSIIAKHTRDEEIKKLHKKFGNFGSGYSSDPITKRFLKHWLENNKEFPDIVRKSWFTAHELKREKEQMRLDGY